MNEDVTGVVGASEDISEGGARLLAADGAEAPEEFVLLLPGRTLEAAIVHAEKLRHAVVKEAFEHPASPLRHVLPNPFTRRLITGVAMGLTLLALIHSKWGKR